jgi:polysaccharide biosynthesis transport protein
MASSLRRDQEFNFGVAHSEATRQTEREVGAARRFAESPTAHEPHFRQMAGVLYRRFWLIFTIAFVGTILATIVALLIPPKYTAYVQLVVEPAQAGLTNERAPAASPTEESIDTHVSLLGSRDHLQRVAETLLQDSEVRTQVPTLGQYAATVARSADADFSQSTDSDRDAASMETASASKIMSELSRRLKVWISALPGSRAGAGALLEQLERGIKINQERRSRVISLAFTSKSAENSAAFANRIVELYVDSQIEQKQADARREMARLDERIAELKFEMEKAGNAVQGAIQQRLDPGRSAGSEGREFEGRLRELERHAAAGAQLYASLLRRQKQMRDQQEIITPGVAIMSFASVPDRPSSHHPILFILPAAIVFAISGGLLAVVLEQLDRGLRSERDINETLGIACIGLVPLVSWLHRSHPHRLLLTQPFSVYSEAIRSIVATLQLIAPAAASKVVVVSSSVPKEGKTTLAVSLAVYAALIGRRVLLVDLDFRHPSILRQLDGKADKGVVDLLLHDCPPEEVIQHIPDLALDYLPMPNCAVDPVALFASERMPRLLRQLRERYECIIIDGPPLLGVTEARLLASLADKVLFVVKWGDTRRELAQHALNELRGRPHSDKECIELPVAVVTQVELKKHARYRYGDVSESLVKYRKQYSRSIGS